MTPEEQKFRNLYITFAERKHENCIFFFEVTLGKDVKYESSDAMQGDWRKLQKKSGRNAKHYYDVECRECHYKARYKLLQTAKAYHKVCVLFGEHPCMFLRDTGKPIPP